MVSFLTTGSWKKTLFSVQLEFFLAIHILWWLYQICCNLMNKHSILYDRVYRISQKFMFWEMWVNAVAMIFTQRKKGRHGTNTHKTCAFLCIQWLNTAWTVQSLVFLLIVFTLILRPAVCQPRFFLPVSMRPETIN